MSDDFKTRIKARIEAHYRRIEPKQPTGRKNKSPEKLVESDVLQWAKENNIFLHVVDSSNYGNQFGRGKAQTGFPDLVGNSLDGLSIYVELKAKDRRSTATHDQMQFIINKIDQNCFAVIVDSVEKIDDYYRNFNKLKSNSSRISYLKSILPTKRSKKDEPLF